MEPWPRTVRDLPIGRAYRCVTIAASGDTRCPTRVLPTAGLGGPDVDWSQVFRSRVRVIVAVSQLPVRAQMR